MYKKMATPSLTRKNHPQVCRVVKEFKMSKTEIFIFKFLFIVFGIGFFVRLIYFFNKHYLEDIVVSLIFIILFAFFLHILSNISHKERR